MGMRETMKKICKFSILLAGTLATLLMVSVAQTAPSNDSADATTATAAKEPQFQQRDPRYQMLAGDVFDITFDLSPEFNQQQLTVQPDGFVTLRGVGDVKVAGQTLPQLRETIRNAYGKTLHDPIISITLREFQ